jgi:hypothetical protein
MKSGENVDAIEVDTGTALFPALRSSSQFRAVYLHVGAAFRVTRVGEFSHVGRLFTRVVFVKITEIAQIKGVLFPTINAVY